MWVAPEARRAGLARDLATTVVEWARESGHERIHLHVTEGNEGARALYESMGFVDNGRRDRLRPESELHTEEMILEL
jgi:ribosomal protein S18 acetylase RimI-like enzyme